MGVEAGLDLAVLDRLEKLVRGRRCGPDLRLVVVHRDGLERFGNHVQLALDLAARDRHVGIVRELAVELRRDVEEEAGAGLLAETVVRGDEEVRATATGGFELELLEQVVELDVLDRQLQIRVGGGDLVGDRLEGSRFGARTGTVGVPDRERTAQGATGRRRATRCAGRLRAAGWGATATRAAARSSDNGEAGENAEHSKLRVHLLSLSSTNSLDGRRGRLLVVRTTAEPGDRSRRCARAGRALH